MEASVHWSSLAVVLCLLCKGWEVQCDCSESPLAIQGGNYTLTKNLESGTLLIYQCADGYYPYPTITRRCRSNGHWPPPPSRFNQICKLVECPDPNVLEYGNVFPFHEKYTVGCNTRYECYPGYTLQGSSNRTCLSNGKWSGSTPICSRDTGDTCSDPGVPAGASKRGSTFTAGGTVTYSCNGNMVLVGSRERTCQENGRWTGREPACYFKFTYDTQSEVADAFQRSIRDSLIYLPPEDDNQPGREIRISKKGKLNIYIALDISDSIEEMIIKRTRQAIITLIKKISTFAVSPNYEIVFFSSDVHEIVNIVDFYDGTESLISVIEKLETFKIGDRSTGKDLNAALKKFEERMTTIQQVQQEFQETRHIFLIFTGGAYNLGGSPVPTLARIKNMVHTSPTGETGSRLHHLESYVFAIGADIVDDDLLPLTVGPEGETQYFRLKKETDLAATFDDVIEENSAMDLCGLHKDYELEGDSDSKRRRYPWRAVVRIQTESRVMLCSGSLVSSHFVLTAASCFPSDCKPENVKVEIDDKNGRKDKTVRKIFLHPNFNTKARQDQGVTEFYDYDVALIQLEESIQISTLARPICIPCTQDTNNALKLPETSTCVQQEELLLKNQREKLNFLSADRVGVYEKLVHAKFGKSRDLCIQKVLNVPGMRISDPTVAVTDNFLCTGGDGDHISCAGDSGQAVYKIHQNRVVQIGVVSWGTESLCRRGGMQKSTRNSRDFHINLFKVVPFLKSTLGNEDQDEYPALRFLSD
ncbi:complement factor B [Oryzias melastigma]|uniref:C3/C5 convertase n=1 Tax=Oryzias melastigma TaxID=30732 RepID=A0A3B3DT01_ORYME|nr:complement factor B [Oryzias melastigma]